MNLKPGELTCKISIGYIKSVRGSMGETLPEKIIDSGRAWAKRELLSGRKIRTQDQQQVVETCLFTTHPNVIIDIDWKITTSDRVYTVRNIEHLVDRLIITAEADARHDRTGIKKIP